MEKKLKKNIYVCVWITLLCTWNYQFSLAAQSCPTLCDPMDCSTPGLPVHHQHPEFAQTHVHRVGEAIQPSHPLLSPSPPAFNLSQHQGFSNESVLRIRWPTYWSFSFSISPSSEYSESIFFWIDWFDLLAVQGILKSLLQHHSSEASILWHLASGFCEILLGGHNWPQLRTSKLRHYFLWWWWWFSC